MYTISTPCLDSRFWLLRGPVWGQILEETYILRLGTEVRENIQRSGPVGESLESRKGEQKLTV